MNGKYNGIWRDAGGKYWRARWSESHSSYFIGSSNGESIFDALPLPGWEMVSMCKGDLEVGKWVVYHPQYGAPEKGRVKSWDDNWVFVVYKCAWNWDRFQDYTGCATDISDLVECREQGEKMERFMIGGDDNERV